MGNKMSLRQLHSVPAGEAPPTLTRGEDLFSIGAHLMFWWADAWFSAFGLACRPRPVQARNPDISEQALRAVVLKLHVDNTRAQGGRSALPQRPRCV